STSCTWPASRAASGFEPAPMDTISASMPFLSKKPSSLAAMGASWSRVNEVKAMAIFSLAPAALGLAAGFEATAAALALTAGLEAGAGLDAAGAALEAGAAAPPPHAASRNEAPINREAVRCIWASIWEYTL